MTMYATLEEAIDAAREEFLIRFAGRRHHVAS